MLSNIDLYKILFLDIETVPIKKNYDELDDNFKVLWDKKADKIARFENIVDANSDEVYERAGIYAEFGKIICISVGFIVNSYNENEFRVKSFYGDDEKEILLDFKNLLDKHYNTKEHLLCGHNAKEFDYPYILRRMIINGVEIPHILNIAGKKPWEVNLLDSMELWKFGDYKSYTSLELLATILNIKTPKDDICGKDIAKVYWEEKDLERIVKYCEKDVLTVAQIILRFCGKNILEKVVSIK